jgi:hypothetical protein
MQSYSNYSENWQRGVFDKATGTRDHSDSRRGTCISYSSPSQTKETSRKFLTCRTMWNVHESLRFWKYYIIQRYIRNGKQSLSKNSKNSGRKLSSSSSNIIIIKSVK